ncbi:MAG: aspartyl protease family protein [Phycisphaerales bacterium]|nr:MAG: aspartyl protease family protein [Phycisphaerales bacterium]
MIKMKSIDMHDSYRGWFVSLLVVLVLAIVVQAARPGWRRQEVDRPMAGGASVEAVNYPEGTTSLTTQPTPSTNANIIDSPALGGFLSWCVVTFTDERSGELELDAVPSDSVIGNYLTAAPETQYAIAVFDTGAGAHIVSSGDADRAGLFDHTPDLLTSSTVEFRGVTGSANAWVSQPLGLFVDGLGVIEPNGLLLDTSTAVGEFNVSVAVGDPIESSHLLTAIGTPLSVYLAAVFRNDQPINIIHNGTKLAAPDIRFYIHDDPHIPSYSNTIPLELRPTGSISVQYFPNILEFDPFSPDFGAPFSPSVLTGFLPMQGLFFISSVDLAHAGRTSLDKDGFIFDTGSNYTLISKAIGSRLGLNPNTPEFEIEILIATGETITAPGYYIDSLEIIASPEWLSFTNVPVVLLDAPSPEGGVLDGIVGTNLFVDLNLVFRGGGLPGQDLPRIEFERLPERIIADIAPGAGDGVVDLLDLAAFAAVWLTNSESFNWNPRADMAPQNRPDGKVDILDLAVFAEHWLDSSTQ